MRSFSFYLFILLIVYSFLNARAKYSILNVNISPANSIVEVIHFSNENLKNVDIYRGKNILPRGEYQLKISKKNYHAKTINIKLGQETKTVNIKLKKKPFNLKILNIKTNTDLYLNDKYILNIDKTEISISNLSPNINSYLLINNNHYFKGRLKPADNNYFFIDKPRFKNKQWKVISSFTFSAVPGLNYFFHAPKSTAGFVYPAMGFYYLFLFGFITQQGWLDSTSGTGARLMPQVDNSIPISPGFLLGGVIISGLIHLIFSGLGAINDMEKIWEPHRKRQKAKITFKK